MTRILVCGGRYVRHVQSNVDLLLDAISGYFGTVELPITLIQGGAKGGDACGGQAAIRMGWAQEVYPAEWEKFGKRAGFLRNHKMLTEGKPEVVFHYPGGVGTKMMVDLASKAGVPTVPVTGQVKMNK